MPAVLSHADALREYLSGAGSDGGAQTDPALSLGHYRSSTEAVSLGIVISTPISGVTILYAGGVNPLGDGILTAVDANTLTWQPAGATAPGTPVNFSGTQTMVVEALDQAGQYLRITGTTPFTPGVSIITLSAIANNVFGMNNVVVADATAGITEYRATILRNESLGPVAALQRWLDSLGTQQVSNSAFLAASGAGTIISTGSLADWPSQGWCQIRNSSGTLKEVVYYTSRTSSQLNVPSFGRAQLGTSAVVGTLTDLIYSVSGIAIGIDTAGVQASGSSIQTIASVTTAPTSVTWNLGVTAATGLQVGTLDATQQVGIWIKRQTPAGVLATPYLIVRTASRFNSL